MEISTVLVTGGGGFVGTALVEKLLILGFKVRVLDTFWYGNQLQPHPNLTAIKGDLRQNLSSDIFKNVDAVIHLACISNDPSFELDSRFSDEINITASLNFIKKCSQSSIKRFIFASSSSVYGIKTEDHVTENLSLEPITPYSVSKVAIETELTAFKNAFDIAIIRPATVYGFSKRLRLDLVTNIFASQAFYNKKINVFGGGQMRPQIHIHNMVEIYKRCLIEKRHFNYEIFNASENNLSVMQIAEKVALACPHACDISVHETDDLRSYKINSEKISKYFQFQIPDKFNAGLTDLFKYFSQNPNLNWLAPEYHNVKFLKNYLTTAPEVNESIKL